MNAQNLIKLKSLHDEIADRAIAEFNKRGELPPALVFFQLNEDYTASSVMQLPDEMVSTFFANPAGKEVLSQMLKAVFTEGHPVREKMVAGGFRPDLAIQVNESWVRATTSLDKAQAMLNSSESLSKDPERAEALVILLHTADATLPVMHPISNTPTRHCSMGEFPSEMASRMSTGRFMMQDRTRPPAEGMN